MDFLKCISLTCLRQVRPVQPEDCGHGGGADQPRGLAVVPRGGRSRPVSRGRHVLADRDGDDLHMVINRNKVNLLPVGSGPLRQPWLYTTHIYLSIYIDRSISI